MLDCELSPSAEHDLLAIALYTESTWGTKQADRYRQALKDHFAAIARGHALSRQFLEHRPELRVSRCEHHFVFYILRNDRAHLIIAVLHEVMDLVARIKDRLEPGTQNEGAMQ
jgi:toxin ParE1/3/4